MGPGMQIAVGCVSPSSATGVQTADHAAAAADDLLFVDRQRLGDIGDACPVEQEGNDWRIGRVHTRGRRSQQLASRQRNETLSAGDAADGIQKLGHRLGLADDRVGLGDRCRHQQSGAGVGGIDEDAWCVIALFEALTEREPIAARELVVEHRHIHGLAVHHVEQLILGLERRNEAKARLSLQDALEAEPYRGVVVEHHDPRSEALAAL